MCLIIAPGQSVKQTSTQNSSSEILQCEIIIEFWHYDICIDIALEKLLLPTAILWWIYPIPSELGSHASQGPVSTGVGDRLGSPSGAVGFLCVPLHSAFACGKTKHKVNCSKIICDCTWKWMCLIIAPGQSVKQTSTQNSSSEILQCEIIIKFWNPCFTENINRCANAHVDLRLSTRRSLKIASTAEWVWRERELE